MISPIVMPSRGDVAFLLIDHAQVTGRDELDALSRLHDGALRQGQRVVFRTRFADGNERRCFSQPIDVRNRPSEIPLDPFDRRGRGRRARP